MSGPDVFYMLPVQRHGFRGVNRRLTAIDNGSVTADPLKAYVKYARKRMQEWYDRGLSDFPTHKMMYATWLLPGRISHKEAEEFARTNRPYRVTIVDCTDHWMKLDLMLPGDQEIEW